MEEQAMVQRGETGAETAVDCFFDVCLSREAVEKALPFLDEAVHLTGIGQDGSVSGREAVCLSVREAFEKTFKDGDPVREPMGARSLAETVAEVTRRFSPNAETVREPRPVAPFRVTACCRKAESGWKIVSLHVSRPVGDDGESVHAARHPFSPREDGFSHHVQPAPAALLEAGIADGMVGCYLEPGLPLYYVNRPLLNRLGFAGYDDFVRAIDGQVINAIHPDDRKCVLTGVAEALSENEAYEAVYRMKKSDGDFIWVNDVGRKGLSQDGRPVCLSVVRDRAADVSMRERLKREIAENRQQSDSYNELFQSVMCGIVQYWLYHDGTVEFVRANREAIRIFGYTSDSFWSKKQWKLMSLVAEEDREMIRSELRTLKESGDEKGYEYRLLRQDGTPCWIIGTARVLSTHDDKCLIQSVYLDVDQRKKAEQENRALWQVNKNTGEMLRRVLAGTSITEFFYYPKGRYALAPERLQKAYGLLPRYDNMPDSFVHSRVYAADREIYRELYKKIDAGESPVSAEFRMDDGDVWVRLTMSIVQYDADNRPVSVVGIVENVTHAREMEKALEKARSQDPMTGLLSREAGLREIRRFMETKSPDTVCALMMLDMDDFGRLNEAEGRVFGDMVLREVADVLKTSIGSDDIALRLGGDEFMMFVKHCDKAGATVLGPAVVDKIRHLFSSREGDVRVSASIGMCVTAVVDEYDGLYRCAESTLQYVKKHGKGKAACYLDTSNELGVVLTQMYPEAHLLNAIDRTGATIQENLSDLALELLGKAKRLDDAVNLLLAKLGKTCGLDRVSIISIDYGYRSFHYAYQWAQKKTDLQMDDTFYLEESRMASLLEEYDEDGFCESPFNPDSVMTSTLRCAIWDDGVCGGCFSFESHCRDMQWTLKHRRILKEVSRVVSSFIMKARADAVSRAKTDFLSRMSHEIRTPMNAIAGMTTIAQSGLDDRELVRDCLEKIEHSNRYLLGLINDVLDMSRIESGRITLNLEPVLLEQVAGQLDNMMRPPAELKGLSLKFVRRFHRARPVYLDVLRFNQIFINIIGNAVKFTEPGGTIVGEARLLKEKDDLAWIRFSVKDTGIGIAPEAIRRIFRSFEQGGAETATHYGGTGLGLTIAGSLVRMMGGSLDVVSEPGNGSEFFFTLPLRYAEEQSAVARPKPAVSASVPRDFSGKRILVVEDNDLNREIAVTLLQMQGFTVETAENGKAALDAFVSHPVGFYDAILMDVRMPVMDGLEATRQIRLSGKEDARRIPVIAMTANAFDEDTRESLQSGMNGHLSKPVDVALMLKVLGDYLLTPVDPVSS